MAVVMTPRSLASRAPLAAALALIELPTEATDPAARRAIEAAARRVYQALSALARGVAARFANAGVEADDLASGAALRLLRAGPLRDREDAPADDDAARRYLQRVLHNLALDQLRRDKRDLSRRAERIGHDVEGRRPIDPVDDAQLPEQAIVDQQERRRREMAVEAADKRLDSIVRALCAERNARRRGSGDELRRTLAELDAAAHGRLDVNALAAESLRARGGSSDDAAELKRARNAIDQRFVRARAALFEAVDAAAGLAVGKATAEEVALLQARARLRTRPGGLLEPTPGDHHTGARAPASAQPSEAR